MAQEHKASMTAAPTFVLPRAARGRKRGGGFPTAHRSIDTASRLLRYRTSLG
jgi:hypothetical protein